MGVYILTVHIPRINVKRPLRQTGHNSTWQWESLPLAGPWSWVHLPQSVNTSSKVHNLHNTSLIRLTMSGSHDHYILLTSSLVCKVRPLAKVTWTQGMESATWKGLGQVYFTTFVLYCTSTWPRQEKKGKILEWVKHFREDGSWILIYLYKLYSVKKSAHFPKPNYASIMQNARSKPQNAKANIPKPSLAVAENTKEEKRKR